MMVFEPEDEGPKAPLAIVPPPPVTAQTLLQLAVERGADLDQLERFMNLVERQDKYEAEKKFNKAFAAFKAQPIKVFKGRQVTDGPLRGKSYAELHDVVNAVSPALAAQGLSFSWNVESGGAGEDWIKVTCTLKHVDGHSTSVAMEGPPDTGGAKNPIQARASTTTYLERYTLKAVLGVAEEGDDSDANVDKKPPPLDEKDEAIVAEGNKAAAGGLKSLTEWWKGLGEDQRKRFTPHFAEMRKVARDADKRGE
jgi:hypothetical protein